MTGDAHDPRVNGGGGGATGDGCATDLSAKEEELRRLQLSLAELKQSASDGDGGDGGDGGDRNGDGDGGDGNGGGSGGDGGTSTCDAVFKEAKLGITVDDTRHETLLITKVRLLSLGHSTRLFRV